MLRRLTLITLLALVGCGESPTQTSTTAQVQSAESSAQRALAERFAPVVVLHPEERYFPMSLDDYFVHLNEAKNEAFFTSGQPAFDRGEAQATVAQVSSDQRYLQYWFFYPKNGCQGMQMDYRPWTWWQDATAQHKTFELCDVAIHEGDWEHVTIELTSNLAAVNKVFFSQHSGGVWQDAATLQFEADRLVVYAALNSHANYASPEGFHTVTTVARPELAALTWIDAVRIGDIVDAATSAGGAGTRTAKRWDTARNLIVWNEAKPSQYRDYLGPWGRAVDAKQVLPISALPDYVSKIVQILGTLAFNVVPDLRDRGQGVSPPSPWGRTSWQQFDRITIKDEHR